MLTLGVPSKGRLQEDTFNWFARAGVRIKRTGSDREYSAEVRGLAGVAVTLIQAGEAPGKLARGELHLAVTGEDLIREKIPDADAKVRLLKPMGFGRADLIVAVPNFWIDVETMADLDEAAAVYRARHGAPIRVATKYFTLARRYFQENGVADYRLVESLGATEGAPAAGAAEAIVDITSTGSTLKANNLKIIGAPILRSQAMLCQSLTADWSPDAKAVLARLMDRVGARENAEAKAVIRSDADAGALGGLADGLAAFDALIVGAEIHCPRTQAHRVAEWLREQGRQAITVSEPSLLYEPVGG